MSKNMLISAGKDDRIRIALVDTAQGNKLYNMDVEHPDVERRKGNVYIGTISSIEPSLAAVFVDYGCERHGFMPYKEISPSYLGPDYVAPEDGSKANYGDYLKLGQKVLVQVDKDERGNKGAALTSFISLAGTYLVLMPNSPSAGGISRRIEGEERAELRETLGQLNIPESMGLIVRTAGLGCTSEELQWDLDALLQHWQAISEAAEELTPPALIYQESNVLIKAIRDYLRHDMSAIITDDRDIYEQAKEYIQQARPDALAKLSLHEDSVPLFVEHRIEHQIESAYQHTVRLPSGGELAIIHTEALVSVDVNSSRATAANDIEQTALETNLEAAEELARQLRLRDAGGLIVIDFIDMNSTRNQRAVEQRLRESLQLDRARTQIDRISRFGLLEMSRQRLRSALGESNQMTCPRCQGRGIIQGTEATAMHILRLIEEQANDPNTYRLHVQVPVEEATYLLNEKREHLTHLEQRYHLHILILPNPHLDSPQHKIQRVRSNTDKQKHSFDYIEQASDPAEALATHTRQPKQQAAVKKVYPISSDYKGETNQESLIQRLWQKVFGEGSPSNELAASARDTAPAAKAETTTRNQRRGGNNTGNRSGCKRRRPSQSVQGASGTTAAKAERSEASEADNTEGRTSANKRPQGQRNRRQRTRRVNGHRNRPASSETRTNESREGAEN